MMGEDDVSSIGEIKTQNQLLHSIENNGSEYRQN